ncbi:hypothetical protein HDU82_005752 [Entophlyctis luteolus]|nr:hypothetical protein HDU82_005752 [Entophlyctis luteolus]
MKTRWVHQVGALTAKNARLIIKKPLLVVIALLMPLAVFPLIAQLTDLFVNDLTSVTTINSGEMISNGVLPDVGPNWTIYFMADPASSSTATSVMDRLCEMTGLVIDQNIIPLGTSADNYSFLAEQILTNYQSLNSGLWAVVIWTGSQSNITYRIQSNLKNYSLGSQLSNLALQRSIDAAILSWTRSPNGYTAGSDSYAIYYDFFKPASTGIDTLSDLQAGTTTSTSTSSSDLSWFTLVLVTTVGSLSFLPVMIIVIDLVVKEKQQGLLGVLRRMGLLESALWVSLMIPMIIVCILVAISASVGVTIVSSRSSIFRVTFDVLFILNLCFSLAMAGAGCIIASLFSKPLLINLSIGMVALATILVNTVMFLEINNGSIIPPQALWFTKCEVAYAKVLLFLFAPFFNYGRVWTDISIINHDGTNISKFDMNQLLHTTRIFPNITSADPAQVFDVAKFNSLYPTVYTVLMLLAASLFYCFLAWYFNQAVKSSEGFSLGPFFPFLAVYWTGKPKRRELSPGDTLSTEKDLSLSTSAVRIVKLSKAYKGVSAVKEFSSVFESGKIYSILGPNGAGKTSLINMLSLVTNPTFGDCFMLGMDIREDTNELQKIMAVCPQFDILYNALTPIQHLKFYYSFREGAGDASKLKEIFAKKLAAVNLLDVADVPCGRFSGGMKRRLSLCLATISESAKIVFLDEPTTGLDPISRRQMWKVIQELKKDRVVILTTHSMQEADVLGDHVCIMHQGRLRASGSSTFLKNKFGDGYQVTLVSRTKSDSVARNSEEATADITSYVSYALPHSVLVSSTGGSFTVAVNKVEKKRLVSFLRALKKEDLLDWSIGSSSLEEVFLKLSAQNTEVIVDRENGQNRKSRICRICAYRPSELVQLYTKNGAVVEMDDVVCKICAESSSETDDSHDAEIVTFSEFISRNKLSADPKMRESSDSIEANQPPLEKDYLSIVTLKGRSSVYSQLNAIVLKNFNLHKKAQKANTCFAIFLVVFVVLGVMAGRLLPSLPSNCSTGTFFWASYANLSCDSGTYADLIVPKTSYSSNEFVDSTICQWVDCAGGIRPAFSFSTYPYTVFVRSPSGSAYSIQYLSQFLQRVTTNAVFTQSSDGSDLTAKSWLPSVSSTNISEFSSVTNGASFVEVDGDSVQSSFLKSQFQLLSEETELSKICSSYTISQPARQGLVSDNLTDFTGNWSEFYPDIGYNFKKLKIDSSSINISLEVVTYSGLGFSPIYLKISKDLEQYLPSGFTDCVAFQYFPVDTYMDASSASYDAVLVTINSITNRALETLGTNRTVFVASDSLPEIIDIDNTSDTFFVPYKLGIAIFTMFFILATSILFPRLVTLYVHEKKENLVEMMRIQGVGLPAYWMGNFLYGFCVIFPYNLVYIIICYFGGITQVVNAGFGYMLLLIVLWTHGQLCLSFLIAGIASKPTSAALVSYMTYIATAALSPFLILSVFGGSGFGYIWSIFPLSGVVSMLNLLTVFGEKDTKRIAINAVIMLVCSSAWALVGIYIHAVRPSTVGIPLDPFFGLFSFKNQKTSSSGEDMELGLQQKHAAVLEHEKQVQEFHSRGSDRDPAVDANEALRVVNLRKEFKSKLAVRDMTLSFKKGETFGLLGPNGAGKTTALSMMTGLLKRTSGAIVVHGKSVMPNNSRGFDEIGVTPQFDTVWPDLTVEEHLWFYCRLRGVPKKSITGLVRWIAEATDLDGDAFKLKSGSLSGGMRRRLSIGIALAGNPRILVLDEPTTGLDPETRRHIWKIIERIRKTGDRCIILTTHSMDEADALCSRIGIVVDGSVRVLGDQLTLKKQFAEGLKFLFRFAVQCPFAANRTLEHYEIRERIKIEEVKRKIEAATGIENFKWRLISSDITYAHANASIREGQSGDCSWMVSIECVAPLNADVAAVFMNVSTACENIGVWDWALNETTLEDVFVKVVDGVE